MFQQWNGRNLLSYYLPAVLTLFGATNSRQQLGFNLDQSFACWFATLIDASIFDSIRRHELLMTVHGNVRVLLGPPLASVVQHLRRTIRKLWGTFSSSGCIYLMFAAVWPVTLFPWLVLNKTLTIFAVTSCTAFTQTKFCTTHSERRVWTCIVCFKLALGRS